MQVNWPLVRSVAWICLGIGSSHAGAYVATLRGNAKAPPLRDVVHELLTTPLPLWLPDLLICLCIAVTVLHGLWPSEALVRRAALCFLARAVTVSVTSLPPCAPPAVSKELVEHWALRVLFWPSAFDLMYSGHTLAFLAFSDLWAAQAPNTAQWAALERCARWWFPFTLVWARQHYTVDVLVSYLVFYQLA